MSIAEGRIAIGLHVSTHGNGATALFNAEQAGMTAAQIFPGNPWNYLPSKFFNSYEGPLIGVVHVGYTINLAAPLRHTMNGVKSQVEFACKMGARYFVLHSGSTKEESHTVGLERWERNLSEVLNHLLEFEQEDPQAHPGMNIVIENSAHGKPLGTSGGFGTWEFVMHTIYKMNSPRVQACLDTAHSFACGEDPLVAAREYGAFIPVVHANSPNPEVKFGGGLDHHSGKVLGSSYESQIVNTIRLAKPKVVIVEAQANTVKECYTLLSLVENKRV